MDQQKDLVRELALDEIKALSTEEIEQLASKLNLQQLPTIFVAIPQTSTTIDFSHVDFAETGHNVQFDRFIFPPSTSFNHAVFRESISFNAACFADGVDFSGASFGSTANFVRAKFGDWARFDTTTFGPSTRFDFARFGHEARFIAARFGDRAIFRKSRFLGSVDFTTAVFSDFANFDASSFVGGVDFTAATFRRSARFQNASFIGVASFKGVSVSEGKSRFAAIAGSTLVPEKRGAWLENLLKQARTDIFPSVDFTGATFRNVALFEGRKFEGHAGYQNTSFETPPEFAATSGDEFIDPHGMYVSFPRRWWPFANGAVRSETSARIRRLRKIMADIHAQDVERDLFILERQAERAIAWNGVAAKPRYLTPWRFLKALGLTLLQTAYQLLSNFGRSIVLPLGWLFASVAGFHAAYWHFWAKPVRLLSFLDRDLLAYSLSNLLPFINALSPARADLLKRLFCKTATDGTCIDPVTILVPLRVEFLALGEGIFNTVLLFLLLQAIRNYFKMK